MSLSWLGIPAWNHVRLGGERSNNQPTPKVQDWHAQRSEDEPRCSADQWRERERSRVLFISEMSDRHLGHCIRFASTKPQHRSRLNALLAERSARTSLADATNNPVPLTLSDAGSDAEGRDDG